MNTEYIDNVYAYACRRVPGACISFHGALQYYALQTQQFNVIHLHADKPFRTFEHNGVRYEYHPLRFIYKKNIDKDLEGNKISVTSLPQTIVDCLYNIELAGGLEEVLYALNVLMLSPQMEKEMLACLNAYNNASLWSRAGYLLSLFQNSNRISDKFINICRMNGLKVKNKLTSKTEELVYNNIWKMYVPRNVKKLISKGAPYGEIVF